MEGDCVHEQFFPQNILEGLGFGTLNKKNTICIIYQMQSAKAHFAPNITIYSIAHFYFDFDRKQNIFSCFFVYLSLVI